MKGFVFFDAELKRETDMKRGQEVPFVVLIFFGNSLFYLLLKQNIL